MMGCRHNSTNINSTVINQGKIDVYATIEIDLDIKAFLKQNGPTDFLNGSAYILA